MSISRETPLGTLTVAPEPVTDGDVVDGPDADVINLDQRRPTRSPVIEAGYKWLAASNRAFAAGATAAVACDGDDDERWDTAWAAHDAHRAAPLAQFLAAAKPARHLRVATDMPGGAA